ncbi:MAG: hypothetical protein PHC70_01385 [Patescibacteria group bacterium]|nr:hypothetical protein [Patescibacteria group bacterium]
MQKAKNLEKFFELLLAAAAFLIIFKGWPGLEAYIPWSNHPMITYIWIALAISAGFAFRELKRVVNASRRSPESTAAKQILGRASLTLIMVGLSVVLGTIVKFLAPRF